VSVKIDISGVPADKQNDSKLTSLLAQMQAAVDNPSWQAAFSIHEAGHKFYIERMGVTAFKYIGPRIIYDATAADFIGYPAAVQAVDPPSPITAEGFDLGKVLVNLAKTKAAGGVFSRHLTGAPDQGDEEDRAEFARACEMLRDKLKEKMPGIQIDENAAWQQAKDEILKDLRSPAFRRQRWEEAHEIKAKLFSQT
jgi:hypothetical protein